VVVVIIQVLKLLRRVGKEIIITITLITILIILMLIVIMVSYISNKMMNPRHPPHRYY